MSASNIPCVASEQLGGTMTVVGEKQVGRIITTGVDNTGMGRWNWICLDRKKTKIYIITAYRVQQETSHNTDTTYTQQKKIMRMQGLNSPNPRKQWIKDMKAQIRVWKLEGKVILMADINSPLGEKKIGEFICNTGLVDLVRVKHGILTMNSHISGRQQIDYILGMEDIVKQ
eukprot:5131794-Ditylum_brightwellii.AAC.1